jgi:tRNA-methyltransferase O
MASRTESVETRTSALRFANVFGAPINDGLIIGTLYFLTWEYIRHLRKAQHYEAAYWAERRGRARVELEMKKLTDVQLNTSEGFFVQPIGHIRSCYRQCVGTPRQGMLVPSSRASVVLTNNMSPESLDGLEEFSHVWLTFKFHLNTNTLKEAKAFSGATTDSNRCA